jgi:hypothetical protein
MTLVGMTDARCFPRPINRKLKGSSPNAGEAGGKPLSWTTAKGDRRMGLTVALLATLALATSADAPQDAATWRAQSDACVPG